MHVYVHINGKGKPLTKMTKRRIRTTALSPFPVANVRGFGGLRLFAARSSCNELSYAILMLLKISSHMGNLMSSPAAPGSHGFAHDVNILSAFTLSSQFLLLGDLINYWVLIPLSFCPANVV